LCHDLTRYRVSWPWGLTLLQGKTLVRPDPLQGKLAVGCLVAYNHRLPWPVRVTG
jgi:hypothetical protein